MHALMHHARQTDRQTDVPCSSSEGSRVVCSQNKITIKNIIPNNEKQQHNTAKAITSNTTTEDQKGKQPRQKKQKAKQPKRLSAQPFTNTDINTCKTGSF